METIKNSQIFYLFKDKEKFPEMTEKCINADFSWRGRRKGGYLAFYDYCIEREKDLIEDGGEHEENYNALRM